MTDDTLNAYRELGRLQGKEMVRKTYEGVLLKHLEQVRAGKLDQYTRGYIDALEYAIRTLDIKTTL